MQQAQLSRGTSGAKSIFCWEGFDDSKTFRHFQETFAQQRAKALGDDAGAAAGDGADGGGTAGVAEGADEEPGTDDEAREPARCRPLSQSLFVGEEIESCLKCLAEAEQKAGGVLKSLKAELDDLRYDPDSPRFRRWNAWEQDTLQLFGPVRRHERIRGGRGSAAYATLAWILGSSGQPW